MSKRLNPQVTRSPKSSAQRSELASGSTDIAGASVNHQEGEHMSENVSTQQMFLNESSRTKGFPGFLFAAVSLMMIGWGDCRPAIGQSDHKPQIEASLLPPTTGEPLTIKPLDMQDIDCIVAEWRSTAARPVLTL